MGVIVPLVLIIVVTVTVAVSVIVCQTKRAKKIKAPSDISLEVNEAYENHFVANVNVAYATNMDLKENQAYEYTDYHAYDYI